MKANIVIMGQSGSGKSTIVNAIIREEVALTGKGTSKTQKNQMYSSFYRLKNDYWTLNLYDTVGIELNEEVTESTLRDIKARLRKTQIESSVQDVNIVWFCINSRNSRFQDFELNLMRKLSHEYEIPFVIVMTQSIDNQIGELENYIQTAMPKVPMMRVLAKDYPLRGGKVIEAYGLDELLRLSLYEYNLMKVSVLESKLNVIQNIVTVGESYIKKYEDDAKECIKKYADKAAIIGWVPGGCIPFVHGLCIEMIGELHNIYGLPSSKDFAADIFTYLLDGLLVTPFMFVPLFSSVVAQEYIKGCGEKYNEVMSNVIKKSKYSDLECQKLMAERIKQQIKLRKRK